MRSLFSFIVFVVMLSLTVAFVRPQLPCVVPVPVSVGTIDAKFDLSRVDLAGLIAESEEKWESAAGRPLFDLVDDGGIAVNLVYDARQQTAEELKSLDGAIQATEARRQEVRAEYLDLRAEYETKGKAAKAALESYEAKQRQYEADLRATTDPTPSEATALVRRGEALDQEYRTVFAKQTALNDLAKRINVLVAEDKELVPAENDTIDAFNDLAKSQGEEYQTGLYTRGPAGSTIDLYVYEDREQLLRLLMHEMGHAVGLGHIADQDSLMYYLNLSKTPAITESDADALAQVCRRGDVREWPALLWEFVTSGTSSVRV
ncbi:MAG: matrixin family metalloprotease [Candidatus Peribacteraceae bacterium]|nr:matrixin family metalloprotease [Candidatus Peribacteraceae bacterium]